MLKKIQSLVTFRREHAGLALVIVVIFIAWEYSVRHKFISSLYFPPPSVLVDTFLRLTGNGVLFKNLLATLTRLVIGFCIGGIMGLGLGLIMGWSTRLRHFFDPLVAAAHPLPKVAIFPLLLIILGIGESPKITAIALAGFFPMLISTMAGVQQINPIHLEVARSYGAHGWQLFRRIIIPGSLPIIIAGTRLALNVTWLVTIAIELVSAQNGLGAMIWIARETLHTEEIYVALAVVSILGFLGNWTLQHMASRLIPWEAERYS